MKAKIFLLYWVIWNSLLSMAQEIDFTIKPIPHLDKLPVKAIHRIFQDSDGYMWYGTFNGLCRSDGYSVKVFRSDFHYPQLLTSNYITYIAEDSARHIWFGTLKGCYILSKEDYSIRPVTVDGAELESNIFTISTPGDGAIWVSMPGELFKFDTEGRLLHRFTVPNHGSVYFVYRNQQGKTLISVTGQGMSILDEKQRRFLPYCYNENYRDIERIIYDDRHKCYWLGTWGKGVLRFHPDARTDREMYVAQPLPINKWGNTVRDTYHMVQDDVHHYLWLTTYNDLYAFQIKPDCMLQQVDLSSILPEGNKLLYEIYKGKNSTMWVSAFDIESFIIDPRTPSISRYPLPEISNRLKAIPAINAFAPAGDGMAWAVQDRYGLCLYHLNDNTMDLASDNPRFRHIDYMGIVDFAPAADPSQVWAASQWRRAIYLLGRNKCSMRLDKTIDLNGKVPESTLLLSILDNGMGYLWIGTDKGLYRYDINKNQLDITDQANGRISGLAATDDGKIWAAVQDSGIISIDKEGNRKLYTSQKKFSGITATTNGQLWLGTTEGEVLLLDIPNGATSITDHSQICGMNGDAVSSIVADTYNHLWIATSNEIKEYNPRNGAYRCFSINDEQSQLNRITCKAVYCPSERKVWIGGIGGLMAFTSTQQLESIPQGVKALITDVSVMGKSILGGINSQRNSKGEIMLNPSDRNIQIEFSSLDFNNIQHIRYAYRLIGTDKEWTCLNSRNNTAFYNQLSKGTYIFEVKATDSNGLWSDRITQLVIRKLPAWYESWWAYTLYTLISLAIIAYAISRYHHRLEERNKEMISDSEELLKMRDYLDSSQKQCIPEFTKLDNLLLDRINRVIEEHIAEPEFDVNVLAENMHMSRSTLTRKIKAITGITPLDYLKQVKMRHAAEMLKNKTATVADVIVALGYSDYKNFAKIFKQAHGCTPSDWQKQYSTHEIKQ